MVSVKGYEGYYEIDEDGTIYSCKRSFVNKAGRLVTVGGNRRSPIVHQTGYMVITLSKDGVTKTHRLHRVIAENLLDNPHNKPYVNHKDGNKQNNNPLNLEWVTAKENTVHAVSTGLFNLSGVNNPSCRFTQEDVSDWYLLITYGVSLSKIAEEYECDRNTVPRLINCEFGKDIIGKYSGKVRNKEK